MGLGGVGTGDPEDKPDPEPEDDPEDLESQVEKFVSGKAPDDETRLSFEERWKEFQQTFFSKQSKRIVSMARKLKDGS
jgi:hypothetical protein